MAYFLGLVIQYVYGKADASSANFNVYLYDGCHSGVGGYRSDDSHGVSDWGDGQARAGGDHQSRLLPQWGECGDQW